MYSIRRWGWLTVLSYLICMSSVQAQFEKQSELDSLNQAVSALPLTPLGIASIFQGLSLQVYVGAITLSDLPNGVEHTFALPQYFALEVGKSMHLLQSKMSFRVGLCYSSSQYRFNETKYLVSASEGAEGTAFANHSEKLIYSKFRVLSLGLPFTLTYYPLREGQRSFSLSVAYDVGFNIAAQRKLAYEGQNHRTIEKLNDDFFLRNFYHNVRFGIGLGKYLNIFYRAPLLSVFDIDHSQVRSNDMLQHTWGVIFGKN